MSGASTTPLLTQQHGNGNSHESNGGSTTTDQRGGEMVVDPASGSSNEALNQTCDNNTAATTLLPPAVLASSTVTTTVISSISSANTTVTSTSSVISSGSSLSSTSIATSLGSSNCQTLSSSKRSAPPPTINSQPAVKKARYENCISGAKPSVITEVRSSLLKWKRAKLNYCKDSYNSHLVELFFLKNDGNLMEMSSWLKRPTPELFAYHKQHKLEGDTSSLELFSKEGSGKGSSVAGDGVGTGASFRKEDQQDQMVEKARHEAFVVARIAQLRKDGLWTEKRLPKVHEPQRPKCHWDYLLEEMIWLSADFAQERKWKKAAAKKCAKMVQKYFQDRELAAERAQKEEEMRLRKIASFMAREVKTFWNNVEKLVHYKINSMHEEKKKKALDQQLSFIVDQTEKYSGMLAESMKKPADSSAVSTRSDTPSIGSLSDEEFEPSSNSEDDEATIAKEDDDPDQQADEVKLLQQEKDQTIDDLLTSLPPEYLASLRAQASGGKIKDEENSQEQSVPASTSTSVNNSDITNSEVLKEEADPDTTPLTTRSGRKRRRSSTAASEESSAKEIKISTDCEPGTSGTSSSAPSTSKPKDEPKTEVTAMEEDEEYVGEDEEDDEDTLAEQEKHEGETNHKQELDELEADNELSLEELRKKYAGELPSEPGTPLDSDDSSDEEEMEDEETENVNMEEEDDDSEGLTGSEDESEDTADDDDGVGLKTLLDDNTTGGDSSEAADKADQQLEEATAVAEALQPKGFTLSSTAVTTPVPFLLKHSLREYQHVGLDWLTTMFEKRLNGILADEMGLGKTIQTIALLAHLACEKSNWGPHLIVVPTSVMLNWEMELKKWCPAFKILTYFGSHKERKMKRQGWTKLNAFHVCITSYKLVIQDHQSFRRKKWKYFILDEAQNIKNFKSKRWQLLLNFQSDRRLLLTGTPLQNNLMELWSLMHFLMPHVFASHREFKEWFSNPVTGMIQGNSEYNDNIIKRLHKVLRPFILRRLKTEVEQQMPKKYEHIVMCRLSKRQRFLYEEFMSRTKTKETLSTGNFLSVINILMQLRKVCNHPNLFEERQTVSPLMMEPLTITAPSCCWNITSYDPFKHVDLQSLNLLLCDLELTLTAFAAHRIRRFQCHPKLITEIDSAAPPPPRCPPGKIRLHVRQTNKPTTQAAPGAASPQMLHPQSSTGGLLGTALNAARPRPIPSNVSLPVATQPQVAASAAQPNVRYQLIQHQGSIKAIPIAVNPSTRPQLSSVANSASIPVGVSSAGATVVRPVGSTNATPNKPGGGAVVSSAQQQQLHNIQFMHTASGQLLLTTTAPRQLNPQAAGSVPSASIATTGQTTVSTNNCNAIIQKLQSIPGIKSLSGSLITMGPGGRPVLRLQAPAAAAASGVRPATSAAAGGAQQLHVAAPLGAALQPTTSQRLMTPQSTPQGTPLGTPQPTPLPSPTPTSSPSRPSSDAGRSPARSSRSHHTPAGGKDSKAASSGDDKKISAKAKSIFYIKELEEAEQERRKQKLHALAQFNTRKCRGYPIYGGDLVEVVTLSHYEEKGWRKSRVLEDQQYVRSAMQRLIDMKPLLDQFVLCVPPVMARPAELHLYHPDPSGVVRLTHLEQSIQQQILKPLSSTFHSITNASTTQFPDARLIQYDCGKLQTLDKLLRQLKSGQHRVLIFTQMTRMLDVFEAFLNYHGHIYLRLDGTTKVQDRQVLMERFNQDKKIFVFILSTRSGGIGVNLTGADTVIFYDSDWNPTMDAQAQDRCHRIGQTRDVHIYRLISEKTIEENILKKANQKRMLGNLAIEGGNFTTATLKQQTIQDLFTVSSEQDSSRRMAELLDSKQQSSTAETPTSPPPAAPTRPGAFENALAAAEDETDVVAARHAMAEAAADLAEFDENIPLNEDANASHVAAEDEPSKAEQELNKLMTQLTGVERYAMAVLERADDKIAHEQSRLEQELEQQKREWELDRKRAIANNEEMMNRNRQEEEEDPLTITGSQIWVPASIDCKELSVWLPPTPPRGMGDLYMDQCTPGYSTSIMPDSALPPVFHKHKHKRPKLSHTGLDGSRSAKLEEAMVAPKSMFDRVSGAGPMVAAGYSATTAHRFRNKEQLYHRVQPKCQKLPRGAMLISIGRSSVGSAGTKYTDDPFLEWNSQEDRILIISRILQTHHHVASRHFRPVEQGGGTDVAPSPHSGHTTNWDLISDNLSLISRCYRSPRSCRLRYDIILSTSANVNQSGAGSSQSNTNTDLVASIHAGVCIAMDRSSGSAHKMSRSASNHPNPSDNTAFTQEMLRRFNLIKRIKNQRAPTAKPVVVPPSGARANKVAQVLLDAGIVWDSPLTPIQVAINRAERLRNEKQRNAVVAAAASRLPPQVQQQLQLVQQSHAGNTLQVTNVAGQATVVQQQQQVAQQAQQQHHQQVTAANVAALQQQQIIGSVVVSKGGNSVVVTSGNIIVSQGTLVSGGVGIVTVPSGAITTTANAHQPQVVTVASLASGLTAADLSSGNAILSSSNVRVTAPPVTSIGAKTAKLALQELRPSSSVAPTVVTVASIAGAKLAPLQVAGIQAKGTRTLTSNQVTYIKQHPLHQSIPVQQQQQLKQDVTAQHSFKRLQIGGAAGQKMPVAVSAANLANITAIQVSQAGRAQLIKHTTGAAASGGTAAVVAVSSTAAAALQQPKTITRTVSEAEMNAILRRQQQQQHNKAGQLASKQQQRGAVVKGAAVGLQIAAPKAGTSNASATGLGTLQIIQGGTAPKNMQPFQVFKQMPQQAVHHHLAAASQGGTVLTAGKTVNVSSVGTASKLLPATVSHQGIKQTIQVVSACPTVMSGAGSIRVSAGAGSGSPTLTLPASAMRMATPQLLSQVSAALQQGQTVTVPVRGQATATGVRISQPVSIQQQLALQQQQQQHQSTPTSAAGNTSGSNNQLQ